VVVEAKSLSPSTGKNLSGTGLLVVLAVILLFGTIVFNPSLVLPLGISALVSGGLGYVVVPALQKLKAGQILREDGPQTHSFKAGTPTMGGIFFVPVGVLIALLWSKFAPEVVVVSLVTLAYGAIGWLDDWQILLQQSNKGISPRMKLILQIAVASAFCLWMFFNQSPEITNVGLPGIILPLGLLFWVLAGFVLVAESNATNLTDGVDGLAAGTSAIAFLGLALIIPSSSPELISPDLMIFSACLSGACLGFVVHNRNRATVFMGDTGSLSLGGGLAAVGLLTGNLWGLFVVSGIFFVESLSVITQVTFYKATKGPDGKGKRLFKMAPLHHHLELSGWTETQVVGVFYLINTVLAILAIVST
jgi:phospho-N-acetylmuramoyl-pentapeptide-transferase